MPTKGTNHETCHFSHHPRPDRMPARAIAADTRGPRHGLERDRSAPAADALLPATLRDADLSAALRLLTVLAIVLFPIWLVLWLAGFQWVRIITFVMFSGIFIAGQRHRLDVGSPGWMQIADMLACFAFAWPLSGVPRYVHQVRASRREGKRQAACSTVHQGRPLRLKAPQDNLTGV